MNYNLVNQIFALYQEHRRVTRMHFRQTFEPTIKQRILEQECPEFFSRRAIDFRRDVLWFHCSNKQKMLCKGLEFSVPRVY